MSDLKDYFDFIKSKGHSLISINPGSDEYALSIKDSLKAIKILQLAKTPILGGDVLTCNSSGLIYVHQSWGPEYHCLNWYCEKSKDETQEQYRKKSFDSAINAIQQAANIAERLKRDCFIVLVI